MQLRAADDLLELVVIVGDALTVRSLPATGVLTLGRDKDCDIRIESGSVSRRHALLHLGPRLTIEDLGSRNGTSIEDRGAGTGVTGPLRRLESQRMEIGIGERVGLGATTIVVRRSVAPAQDVHAGAPLFISPAMKALNAQVRRAARGKITILLLGETGVGKEVFARVIHEASERAREPFVALDCGTIPQSLAEDQLFGHERGAFTGADREKPGYFEAASGGTLFLDEVGELPLDMQVKFLRVLEEMAVVRVGGRAPRPIDVRIVAATNRDLRAAADKGDFRSDLLHRLDAFTLEIPPLRERTEEIESLANGFIHRFSLMLDRALPTLAPETLALFMAYRWPGNVRELRNVIERAVTLCQGPVILPEDLPPKLSLSMPPTSNGDPGISNGAATPSERERIMAALEACAGNQTRAAARLDMPLRTLVNRLDVYGLKRPRKPRE